jgi:hypothetical protein
MKKIFVFFVTSLSMAQVDGALWLKPLGFKDAGKAVG